MDRPERMQAAGDASRRQSTPGAAPEPGQAAFRGRRVAEVPGAGSSPSRSEPRATRATTGVSGSPGGPVSREAGRAGRRFQPYSAGEAGRPGASHLPAGEPSVPAVPREPGQEPEPSTGFKWKTVYDAIKSYHQTDALGVDHYAEMASAAALHEIGQAIGDAYVSHRAKSPRLSPPDPTVAMKKLRIMRNVAAQNPGRRPRVEAIRRSLDDINRLTRAKLTELKERRAEFRSASLSRVRPVPGREDLGRWLQAQADAAPGTDLEHSYFTQLEQELSRRRDPWTVSRELMGGLPSPGDAQQAGRLRDAHERLVRAIACGLSQRAAVHPPGVAQAPRESWAPVSMQQGIVRWLNNRNPLLDWQVQAIMSAVDQAVEAGTLGVSTSRPEAWARDLVDRVQTSTLRPFGDLTESERDREWSDLMRLGELVEELGGLGYL